MSAREFLLARLTGALIPAYRANKMIDDLLHEEAEKIRRCAANVWEGPEYRSERHAIEVGADLIDPHVQ